MVLQLAGGAHSRIGQLPDDPGPAQLRRRLVHLRPQSACRVDSRRARAACASGARQDIKPPRLRAASATSASRRAGARRGSTARWASTIATRPTSCRRRWLTPGVATTVPAATCTRASAACRCRRHALLRQPERHHGRRPAEVRQARHLQHRLRRRHPHLRHHAGEEIAGVSVGGGALVPAEHAAAERRRCRCCPRCVRAAACRARSPPPRCRRSGTPGALGDTFHGLSTRSTSSRRRALFDTATLAGELTWMQWSKVTQNEAVFKGSSQQLHRQIDKPIEELSSASRSTSRRRGSRSCRAWICRRR